MNKSDQFTNSGSNDENVELPVVALPIAAALIGASATLASTGAKLLYQHLSSPTAKYPSGAIIENQMSSSNLKLEKVFQVAGGHHEEINDTPVIRKLPAERNMTTLLNTLYPNTFADLTDDEAAQDFIINTLIKEFDFSNFVSKAINTGQSAVVYSFTKGGNQFGIAFVHGFYSTEQGGLKALAYVDKWETIKNLIKTSNSSGDHFINLGINPNVQISYGENVYLMATDPMIQVTFTAASVTRFVVSDIPKNQTKEMYNP